MCVCHYRNVPTLTSPPILKLWGTQGYLWLPYDLTEVIKLIGETFEQKKYFFQKNTLCHSFCISVIPSVLLSFHPYYCHSIRITVIPSGSLSFLPNYCHSFHIGVIPSEYCYSFRITVIPSGLLSFLPDYCHYFQILSFLSNIVIPSELFRELQILTSSKSFPYPKGKKNGHLMLVQGVLD